MFAGRKEAVRPAAEEPDVLPLAVGPVSRPALSTEWATGAIRVRNREWGSSNARPTEY
jgi:hypothetical protein